MNVLISDLVRDAEIGKAPPRSRLNIAGPLVCLVLTGGPAWGDELHPPVRQPDQSGVVFAINGSGCLQATSTALAKAVADAGLPLAVVTVKWSQGRIVADHTDWRHAREQGCRLAGQIASYRQANPGQAIYVVAHSAGSGVALTAAETAPAGSVNRVILLAPSVSTDHDLRPALRGTKDGIDVFCSRRDAFALGFGVALVGTADGCRGCQAAGRVGFRAQVESADDAVLYAKLTQHPWERCQARLGNHGFHMGALRPRFLQTFVLPLLNPGH